MTIFVRKLGACTLGACLNKGIRQIKKCSNEKAYRFKSQKLTSSIAFL